MHLTDKNLDQYIKSKYGKSCSCIGDKTIQNFEPLLQSDYGGPNDCTLTSITAIINFITKNKNNVNDIYNNVEAIAKKHLYKDQLGTPVITVRTIFNKSLKKYCKRTAGVKYGKDLGFNINTIINNINKGNPLILSLISDGLGYYRRHSVSIVGYKTFLTSKKRVTFLKVYDNWNKSISYIDYKKISFVSILHYLCM